MTRRVRVGILGATGTVGQRLLLLLERHPWFEVTALAASDRSAGKPYRDAVHWLQAEPLSGRAAALEVCAVRADLDVDLVFSALDGRVASEMEPEIARAGIPVVSNASAFRAHPSVPLIVPEVNADHLTLVESRTFGAGCIVTNPNCCVAGLVLALKPLSDAFGIESVAVTTLQALSGAGYPGVASLDALGNVIPFIPGEEEKIASEPRRILGRLEDGRVVPAGFSVGVQVTRVPVVEGHLLSVAVRLGRRVTVAETREALAAFRPALDLPTAPRQPIRVFDDDLSPQPRLHASLDSGMTVGVGRLRSCPLHDVRFVALVHNTMRGAAGAALLNAELLVAHGLVQPPQSSATGDSQPPAPPASAAIWVE